MGEKQPRCKTLRCKKPARVREWCRTHAMREADRLARERVMQRDQTCQAAGKPVRLNGNSVITTLPCSGSLQWCHIHSRSYHAIRHLDRNAMIMCAAHHAYYTFHPLEWETFCRDRGVPWDSLRLEALHGAASWDLGTTLEKLMANG